MGVLDEVIQMKSQGMDEEEIINELSDKGISPMEIDDALNQSQIKDAIADIQGENTENIEDEEYNENEGNYEIPPIQSPISSVSPLKQKQNYKQQSRSSPGKSSYSPYLPMSQETNEESQNITEEYNPESDINYPPQPYSYSEMQQIPSQIQTFPVQRAFPQQSPQPQENSEEIYYPQQPQENYPPQEDSGYGQYYAPQENYGYDANQNYGNEGYNTDSIIEISEQIVDSKLIEIVDKLNELNESKILIQSQVENIESRLKKIESIIDRLQASILEKVGSYGENLFSIRKEMAMMQDSFSKVINPLTDKFSKVHSSSSSQSSSSHPEHHEKHHERKTRKR